MGGVNIKNFFADDGWKHGQINTNFSKKII